MAFYIRKSIKLGKGVKVNLSKSGVGLSAGVKGARANVGPRGAGVHVGRHGIYYRKQLGGKTVPHIDGAADEVDEQASKLETAATDAEMAVASFIVFALLGLVFCFVFSLFTGWPFLLCLVLMVILGALLALQSHIVREKAADPKPGKPGDGRLQTIAKGD